MSKFVKRPDVFEAIQLKADNLEKIKTFMGMCAFNGLEVRIVENEITEIKVKKEYLPVGCWIVRKYSEYPFEITDFEVLSNSKFLELYQPADTQAVLSIEASKVLEASRKGQVRIGDGES